MKDNQSQKNSSYEDFLKADATDVPPALTRQVLSQIKELLNPSPWMVFCKILGIHAIVGFLSLSVCHQFEMNPFGTSFSMSDWLMSLWGHKVCMVGCGVLFVGLSILSAGYFLTLEEVQALRRHELTQTLALSAISIGTFGVVGSELAFTMAALWVCGAMIGGFFATEAVWQLKNTAKI